jgi:hypothetical protein
MNLNFAEQRKAAARREKARDSKFQPMATNKALGLNVDGLPANDPEGFKSKEVVITDSESGFGRNS